MKETKKLTMVEAIKIANNEGDEQKTMKVFVDAKVTFLKTQLDIKYLKKEKGYTLLLAPEDANGTEESSLSELVKAVKSLLGDDTNIGSLTNLVGKDLDNIKFTLAMAFLYINKVDEQNTVVDYAFLIKTKNLTDPLPDKVKDIFKVDSIQLAIWNTKNTNILKAMKITTPDDALKELEAPQN